jgi:hypothetical protein
VASSLNEMPSVNPGHLRAEDGLGTTAAGRRSRIY